MLHKTTIIGLLLSSSICAGQAFAMQDLNDESMSDVVGRDGITVQLYSNGVSMDKVLWHDNDGLQPVDGNDFGIDVPEAGAVVIDGLSIINQDNSKPWLDIQIDSDGGELADGSQARMNVAIKVAATDLQLEGIYVGSSNDEIDFSEPYTSIRRGVSAQSKIMDAFELSLGSLDMNVQFGHQSQGHLMLISGEIKDGIQLSNVGILANDEQYMLSMGDVRITDDDSNDLTFIGTGVDIASNGFIITPSQRKLDVNASSLTLGGVTSGINQSVGAMSISGLDLGNKIMILGH